MKSEHYLEQKEKEYKKMSEIVDIGPGLLNLSEMMRKGKLLDWQKELIKSSIEEVHRKIGERFVERALSDGLFTEETYFYWLKKGIGLGELCTILSAYYAKKDGHAFGNHQPIIIMTTDDSIIYKHRKEILKKLGVQIMSIQQVSAMAEMEKKDAI